MRVSTDELGVLAFVLPEHPSATFELHPWPDGSYSLELVDDAADEAAEWSHDLRSA
jgi:hypothetical protein